MKNAMPMVSYDEKHSQREKYFITACYPKLYA